MWSYIHVTSLDLKTVERGTANTPRTWSEHRVLPGFEPGTSAWTSRGSPGAQDQISADRTSLGGEGYSTLTPTHWLLGQRLPCDCLRSGTALPLLLGKVNLGSSTVSPRTEPAGTSAVEYIPRKRTNAHPQRQKDRQTDRSITTDQQKWATSKRKSSNNPFHWKSTRLWTTHPWADGRHQLVVDEETCYSRLCSALATKSKTFGFCSKP